MTEDLGIKIVSHEEKLWTKVKEEAAELITQRKNELIIQQAILALAEEKIKQEVNKRNGKGSRIDL